MTIRNVAELTIELRYSKSNLVKKELPIDDPVQRLPDITLARKALDWKPVTELEVAVSRTVSYFQYLVPRVLSSASAPATRTR